jgi:predicted PurR-regulated permease PerM
MKVKLIITVIVIILVLVVGWYVYSIYSNQQAQPIYNFQPKASDASANIMKDLSQVPDDSALNSDINSLSQDIEGF